MWISCPLLRNWPQISARRSQATTLWYSVRSPTPLPRNSLVATTKFVKARIALNGGQLSQLPAKGE